MTSYPPPSTGAGRISGGVDQSVQQTAIQLPVRGPNVLTSVTSRGTVQMAKASKARLVAAAGGTKPTSIVARWG